MLKSKLILPIAAGLLITSACIPARKYDELQAKYDACDDELSKYKNSSESIEKQLKDLKVEHEKLQDEHTQLERDNKIKEESYNNLTTRYDKLNEVNMTLLDQVERLQKLAENQSASLSIELQQKQLELQRKEDELKRIADDLKKSELELREAQLALKEKEASLDQKIKRIDELEALLKAKDEAVNSLKGKVSEALLAFKNKGLTVEERNGKVYVKMEAKLLFASGSTKVGTEGKDALIKLATVLEDQSDMEIVVEGHTDTDKLNSSSYPHNNWELSVLRSTAVVEIMLGNSKINPKLIAASGRSQYLPVSEDKAKNRRIEIILTPNLDELYRLINNE